ncbi:MAG: hypothetical protein Q8O01_06570 [Candidatus Omnitrophota bacterium]|nr:hypothetical protein [Candidatus Omnitrophota bacterium]
MRLLVDIATNSGQKFLVRLHKKELVKEVKRLVNKKRYSQAIAWALFNGKIEGELTHEEIPEANVDLIITEESARWDLTCK